MGNDKYSIINIQYNIQINMDRLQAIELLHQYVKSPNMINHCLASEAVMRALAKKLGRDEEKWALAGLLHDLDVENVNNDMYIHGKETARILSELNVDEEIIDAIRMHNEIFSRGEAQQRIPICTCCWRNHYRIDRCHYIGLS